MANNQYVNRVDYDGSTLIDITDTTATASDVASGKYFYLASGQKVQGSASGGGTEAGTVTQDANGFLVLDDDPHAGPTLITKSITANGTYNASSDSADGYSSVTVNVSGGGGGDMSDPIRFFDYDGTLVASYSAVPQSLPSVPSHTGLTNGTWNYTLQEVTTQFNAIGTCDVGANYETVSGATEIDIELQAGRLHPYLSLAVNGTVTIDWGDNSTSTSTGASLTTRKSDIHHEYASAGSYTIKISPTSGTSYALLCTSAYSLLNNNNSTQNANRVYSNCVRSVRVGANCSFGQYAFEYCENMQSISIPSNTNIDQNPNYIFGYCYSLKYITLPQCTNPIHSAQYLFSSCYSLNNVSIAPNSWKISSNCFSNCNTLQSISIPSSYTSINNNTFYQCYSIKSLRIPSGVTSIGTNAFQNCYGIAEYHFKSTTPPTLANTNAFSGIQSDCVIYVPSAKLNDYKTAENWSTYASYMVGE